MHDSVEYKVMPSIPHETYEVTCFIDQHMAAMKLLRATLCTYF
jgi:hypothetical protein